ncbi:7-cyano-7-deazaguanine synthase QueC [Brucella intermedia]|jgi:7-cyano-7-deazaguanine synthase|uniref:7-cyano-7-deazaguanine synthase n=1 Tax=Brucella ciceri TaxID=391287 RepID=A0ABX1DSS5_9HYPH|nr:MULTISPECIES: 7-cyano-7-deazaguanine synthase QueC [Brucella/Ochrobactrum group]NKC27974.1 7-cyano-7-deazaguanine synthase QueC [Brucella ciceri]PJT21415.1 7-cyano-7-deazaguanine synthase QueC [Ochrobactrum sp. 30A/1000/2015]PJT37175.1 7-cyano-7-deazaguanine synthase QueC [Ochrobactrum sp. 27A/999/2015]PJT42380.1 7-cyano-7-deazaguanine synthase QueC [Ochrobactrum sp. 23A/997/2015]KAB2710835.1 7-cyano-7-deazaguanine synthase QueC [Brucella intermedia]
MKTLVVCSGGLDSVSLAYRIAAEHQLTAILSFDYGQRHRKELDSAKACAERLGVPHQIIDIRTIGASLTGSALTDDVDVPDGHYAEETMKITVVPNRNAIMLAIAFGVAAAQKADAVALAVHGGDHFIYPDCRPDFIDAFQTMQDHALDGYADIKLLAPYVHVSKADIVIDGAKYGTPFAATWSCYKGGEHHCGRCGTCVERREAFHLAGIEDPTFYVDADFWRAAIEKRSV